MILLIIQNTNLGIANYLINKKIIKDIYIHLSIFYNFYYYKK